MSQANAPSQLVLARRRTASALCRAEIARGSKSFALASRLLPADLRDHVAALYTWCRRADDAVDGAPREAQGAALARLRRELDRVYEGRVDPDEDVALAAFQETVVARAIPRAYPEALLDGMEMDHLGMVAPTLSTLLEYCYRAAGVVGLMMSHVMGVADAAALPRAAHLGIAMQLTNICRDVAEDWRLGRLYLPQEALAAAQLEDLPARLARGETLPESAREALAGVVRELLALAERYYRSGEIGISSLPWRAGLAVRAARFIYGDIGRVLARRDHDVFAGRAVVPGLRKSWLVLRSLARGLRAYPARPRHFVETLPNLRFAHDILPV